MSNNTDFHLPSSDYRFEKIMSENGDSMTIYVKYRENSEWLETVGWATIQLNDSSQNMYYKVRDLAKTAKDHHMKLQKVRDFATMTEDFFVQYDIDAVEIAPEPEMTPREWG